MRGDNIQNGIIHGRMSDSSEVQGQMAELKGRQP
jgi:hypothetical protein